MTKKEDQKGDLVLKIGLALIVGALILLFFIFLPVLKNKTKYLFLDKSNDVEIILEENNNQQEEGIVPADKDFSLIIPKIGANAKVVKDVDPMNEREYRSKLREGVAHAKGSGLPNDNQTIFIFAHSSDNFYQNNQYNSIFYLLRKLQNGDEFFVVYEEKIYEYQVTNIGSAPAEAVEYLQDSDEYDAVLMTCWPPGTDMKRLLVFGKKI